jgi:hypothetical protein
VRYFLSAALGLTLTGVLLSQNSGQTTQPSTPKVVAEGYHIVRPETDDLRPTTATPAQTAAKSTKKKKTNSKYQTKK